MARKTEPLSDKEIKNAKPKGKIYYLYDGGGLNLVVMPSGSKLWRLKYRFGNKERRISLGVYPDTPLKQARASMAEMRKMIAMGRDPAVVRKVERVAGVADNSFQSVALEWFERTKPTWAESHARTVIRRLERDIFPDLGPRLLTEITTPDVLTCLRKVEDRGAAETCRRERQIVSQVFVYGISIGRCTSDPAAHLTKALKQPETRHFPAITKEADLKELLTQMWEYRGSFIVRCALRLTVMLLLRPGELRQLEWSDVDLERQLIEMSPEKMKRRKSLKVGKPHLIPLAPQAVEVLEEIRKLTGGGKYVFPCQNTRTRPMSSNTVRGALRRMGYTREETVAHSFRTTASTLLNESGLWSPDAIELQLAHVSPNKIRAIYNRAEKLEERRRMMIWWADRLDKIRNGQMNKKELVCGL